MGPPRPERLPHFGRAQADVVGSPLQIAVAEEDLRGVDVFLEPFPPGRRPAEVGDDQVLDPRLAPGFAIRMSNRPARDRNVLALLSQDAV